MSIKDGFISFNNCVSEIEKLINLSILNGFYSSDIIDHYHQFQIFN